MSWENNAYAPSKENVRTAMAIQSLARDPFSQMGVPSNVEGVIGSYLFQNAPSRNLKKASNILLRNARNAQLRRAVGPMNLGQSYLMDPNVPLPPEAYLIPAAAPMAPVALRTGPFTPPPSPTPSERRAAAALRNLNARQKSRRRRGKMELPVNFASLAPFGNKASRKSKGEKGRSRAKNTRRRRSNT